VYDSGVLNECPFFCQQVFAPFQEVETIPLHGGRAGEKRISQLILGGSPDILKLN
jgi:hypothetical protein